jgi:GH15 family glucan-1,4-alpha-glucosidase
MAWVALDRAVRTIEEFDVEGPLERWREVRDRIHADVCARGYNAEMGAFTQYYGSDALDASLLMVPLVGFLPADDDRVRSTVEAIERGLTEDGLVLRYRTEASADVDGLKGHEGAFLACSFWMADCLYLIGRYDDAHAMFDKLIGLRNDLGLLAEEYDVRAGRQVGNFPQAFSHVSLVNAAFNLSGHASMADQVVVDTRPFRRGAARRRGRAALGMGDSRDRITPKKEAQKARTSQKERKRVR